MQLAPLRFAQLAGDDDADALFRSLRRKSDRLLADLAAELAEGVTTRRQARAAVARPRDHFAPGFLAPLAEMAGDALFAAHVAARVRVGRKAEGIAFADHPAFPAPAEAVEFLLNKRLMPWSEMEGALADYRAHAFWMARVEEVRILATVRDKLVEALEAGISEKGFVDAIEQAVAGDFTKARLSTVYRTNLQSAYQAGNYVQLHHPDVADLFPYYQYVALDDGRGRPAHLAMNGTVFAADHKIWLVWWPPNGYNCRCTVIALTLDDAKARGITRSARWPEVSPGAGAVQPDSNFAGPPTDFDWQHHALDAEREAAADVGKPEPGRMSPEEVARHLSSDPLTSVEALGEGQAGVNVSKRVADGVTGIFKPARGERKNLREGIKGGTYYKREIAAHKVDQAMGLGNVPVTAKRSIGADGVGSVQEWVSDAKRVDEALAEDLMDGRKHLENEEELFAFDLTVGMTDRHFDNVLVRETERGLRGVAIDQGLCFSSSPSKVAIRVDYAMGLAGGKVSPAVHAALDRLIGNEATLRKDLKSLLSKREIDDVFYRARRLRQLDEWPDSLSGQNRLCQSLGFRGLFGWA